MSKDMSEKSSSRSHSTAYEMNGMDNRTANPLHSSLVQMVDLDLIKPPLFSNSVDDLMEQRRLNFQERLFAVKRVDEVKFQAFNRAAETLKASHEPSNTNKVYERFRNNTIDETAMISRNLPPLINKRYIDPRTVQRLIFISEAGGILGSICFIVGSFYFYPEYDETMTFCDPYDCILIGSLLFVLGSFFFFMGSCSNFVKNDAASCQDWGLTFNATLYCVANFLFTVGSCFFCPKLAHEHIPIGPGFEAEFIGLGCFIFGSVVFILAPLYDIYRAHQLRNTNQISYLSMAVEIVIAIMYIGGSILYFVGSIYFIPELFERFAVTMFVVGSFCFLGACLSSPFANLYRYWKRRSIIQRRKKLDEIDNSRSNLLNAGDLIVGESEVTFKF